MLIRKVLNFSAIGLLLVASISLATPAYYRVKAELAQILLIHAWQATLANPGVKHKPWDWADTWPVAKMTILKKEQLSDKASLDYLWEKSFIVLADSSGESLAFAPGMMTPQILPGDSGHSFIAAHRDTQFSILQHLNTLDHIIVERQDGQQFNFEVDEIQIVDINKVSPVYSLDGNRLTLVTCYPFDSSDQNPQFRFLVTANLVN
ncbi:class GN sortase [Aliikangiella maris]|uniref:Class GN sortase n=2 Tax=Aliikangiella maris TaxID=3162458 RepID=A0ABV3MSK9_9GAMM